MSLRWLGVLLCCLCVAGMISAQNEVGKKIPERGFVPDEKTAIKIAEAILAPIYGDQQVAGERPFHAVLVGGIWSVEGTLHSDLGGVATVRLRRKDGAILSVIHGK